MASSVHNVGPTGTQAIERGLTLLELVSQGPASVRDLAERTTLPRSTVTRLVGALERFHYLVRDDDGAYRLGTGALMLASHWHKQSGIEQAATPHLEALVRELHETGHLTIREGLHSVCIAFSDSPQSIRLTMAVGDRVPLHVGAHAKILLAHAPPAVQEAVLGQELVALTPRSIADAHALRQDLDQIRLRGYAESYGEIDAGAYALAAPIRAVGGSVVAAIGVSGPTHRILEIPNDKLKAAVVDAARTISADLGFTPPSETAA
jgi:DNA-binding IclR family transcriptional regulator